MNFAVGDFDVYIKMAMEENSYAMSNCGFDFPEALLANTHF